MHAKRSGLHCKNEIDPKLLLLTEIACWCLSILYALNNPKLQLYLLVDLQDIHNEVKWKIKSLTF